MDRAVISYVHPDHVRAEFMESMLALREFGRTPVDGILTAKSGPNISRARNMLVERFMREQSAPWLWMVDTDMVFAPDLLDRLMAAAHPQNHPIVGGLCFAQGQDGEAQATMYELTERDGRPSMVRYTLWPEDQLFEVAVTGAACLLMHRDALDRIAKYKPHPAAPWFQEVPFYGELMGEDMTFCMRARAAGLQIFVHTGIQMGHMKSTMLGKVT